MGVIEETLVMCTIGGIENPAADVVSGELCLGPWLHRSTSHCLTHQATLERGSDQLAVDLWSGREGEWRRRIRLTP